MFLLPIALAGSVALAIVYFENCSKVISLFLCSGMMLVGFCCFEFIYKGTPRYIHKYSTLTYEEKAKNYFEQNAEKLHQLAELRTKIEAGQFFPIDFTIMNMIPLIFQKNFRPF